MDVGLLADAIRALTTLHVAVFWQIGIGQDGGGIVLSPVEVVGGFGALASAIGYMFKRVVDLGDQRVKDRDAELARLSNQNERLLSALFRSAANTDRGLGIVEKRVGGGGNA